MELGSARLRASFAFQRGTEEGVKDTRTYSMEVKAKAVQEEIPGGRSRVLTVLEILIKEEARRNEPFLREAARLYRDKPLLDGARVPRFVLAEARSC